MSSRLSQGQVAVLDQFNRVTRITKQIPEYWNPKPLLNDQIDRLEARGFIEQDGPAQRGHMSHSSFYKITEKGASCIGAKVCASCGGATHEQEAACLHCGHTKPWAQTSLSTPHTQTGE